MKVERNLKKRKKSALKLGNIATLNYIHVYIKNTHAHIHKNKLYNSCTVTDKYG